MKSGARTPLRASLWKMAGMPRRVCSIRKRWIEFTLRATVAGDLCPNNPRAEMCPIPCPSSLVACDSIRPSMPSSPIGIVADSCIAFSSSVICCSTASAR